MFNNEDILTLAKAGFTAQQIAALNMVQTPPAPAPVVTPPAPAPVVTPPAPAPVVTPPAAQIAQSTDVVPISVQIPAPAPAPAPATVAPHTVDDVLSAITGLSQQMQQNNLFNMTQTPQQPKTATEVLAQIINPPAINKEV